MSLEEATILTGPQQARVLPEPIGPTKQETRWRNHSQEVFVSGAEVEEDHGGECAGPREEIDQDDELEEFFRAPDRLQGLPDEEDSQNIDNCLWYIKKRSARSYPASKELP